MFNSLSFFWKNSTNTGNERVFTVTDTVFDLMASLFPIILVIGVIILIVSLFFDSGVRFLITNKPRSDKKEKTEDLKLLDTKAPSITAKSRSEVMKVVSNIVADAKLGLNAKTGADVGRNRPDAPEMQTETKDGVQDEIDKLMAKFDQMEAKKVDTVKIKSHCVACDGLIRAGDLFCSDCGFKVR